MDYENEKGKVVLLVVYLRVDGLTRIANAALCIALATAEGCLLENERFASCMVAIFVSLSGTSS